MLHRVLVGPVTVAHLTTLDVQALDQRQAILIRERLPTQWAFGAFCGAQLVDALLQLFHLRFQARVLSPGIRLPLAGGLQAGIQLDALL